MTNLAAWLRGLGLDQYEAAFRENGVDASVLPDLTADDLKEMGVAAVGHRRKLLAAIAGLRRAAPPLSTVPAPPPTPPSGGEARRGGAADTGAERRQLTVLFCDLVGSTALSARLDPEDLREVMAAYHRAAAEAVRRQGGHVAKFLGDGVLACFGWPAAHEDDAERAVRAGLAAAAAVARLETPAGPLAARVGIATGPVVVGHLVGEGEALERGVVGETPNLAARLQGFADPGMVVLDETTRRLTGALFDCADLGAAALKGVPGPVRAWRALGDSGVESRFEALRAGTHAAPLVGRGEELELLLHRWRRARSGEGQVALLGGEAGIGKSRLAAAFREALVGGKHEGFALYCSPQHTDSALHPVVARLERTAGLAPADAPEERLAKLEALLTALDSPPEDVALVAELLSVPTLGRWPALDLSPQRRRERLLAALVRHVRALALRRPVLAVLEDAHWLDPTTRELLDLLMAAAPEMALLLVVTYRPELDAGPWLGLPQVTALRLNRLGPAEHKALLRHVARGKALPAEVEAELLARTDGVPLFVEEVTAAVLESGLLREEADRWALEGPLPSAAVAVPSSLQASLVARLDRLSSVREAVQAAAVIGREFAHDVVAAVSGLPEQRLRDALGRLEAAGLLQRRGEPPEAVYAFRHALIRDAAHGTLLRERKRGLHRLAAEATERLRPEVAEREPEVLAQHRAEAGQAEAAIALYLRAGERAAARPAFREARAHLARGLALLPGVADGRTARRLEVGLRVALGNVAIADEGIGSEGAERACGRAVELCRGLDDDALLARALVGLWVNRLFNGDLAGALPLAEEGVEAARRHHGPSHRAGLLDAALGVTHYYRGRSDLARPLFEAVLAGSDTWEVGAGLLGSAGALASFFARVLAVQGALERSAALAAEAVARARQAGHLLSFLSTLMTCCGAAWLARDAGSLRAWERELTELAEARGYPYHAARGRSYAGWAAVEDGRVEEGIGLLAGTIAWPRGAGLAVHVPYTAAMLADAHLLRGSADATLAQVEEALRTSARGGEGWLDADLHRRLGCVLLRLDPRDAARAEGEFRRALEIARSQSARLFELRAARDLARLRRDQGRLSEARELLAPVYASFTEGFAFPDLVEARALLEDLGAAPAHGVDRRQEEVRKSDGSDRLREPVPGR